MAKRKRKKQIHVMVSDCELALIKENMQESGIKNFSIYVRKTLLNGYITQPNHKLIKEKN